MRPHVVARSGKAVHLRAPAWEKSARRPEWNAPRVYRPLRKQARGTPPGQAQARACPAIPMVLARRSMHEFLPGDPLQVLEEDLIVVGLGEIERFKNLQRDARKHRSVFGVERAIGGKYDLVDGIEFHAALGRGHAAENRGIGIEILLEIIERALFQALAQRDVILVAGARTDHVPARADAAF